MTGIDLDFYKEGEIPKGVVLTEEMVRNELDTYKEVFSDFLTHPDILLDLITKKGDSFKLYFYQRIFIRACMRYRYVITIACFKKGTKVLTKGGLKNIEDFEGGEEVLSHKGWEIVEKPTKREWDDSFYRIKAKNGFEDAIECTNSHEFLTMRGNVNSRQGIFNKGLFTKLGINNQKERKAFYNINLRKLEDSELNWVPAKNLEKGDYLLSYIDEADNGINSLQVQFSERGKNIFNKDSIKINSDFCEFMGIWLAEGSWTKNYIDFTIGINEERLKNRIIYLFNSVFGIDNIKVYERENNSQIIRCNSVQLSNFFSQLFSCENEEMSQWNKRIPEVLLFAKPQYQLQLLKGWLDGDGYYRKVGNSGIYKGTTVAPMLMEGMKSICYRNFINPSITIENREGENKVYNLNFNGILADKMEEAIENNLIFEMKNEYRLGKDYPIQIGDNLYMRNKIYSIEEFYESPQEVYCLKVKNNPSFTVSGVIAHNCRAFSKSFISILAGYMRCMFLANENFAIAAPGKAQGAKIAQQKIKEIWNHWPLLEKELVKKNMGTDYVNLVFKNGSTFQVTGALDSTRGERKTSMLIDELRRVIAQLKLL